MSSYFALHGSSESKLGDDGEAEEGGWSPSHNRGYGKSQQERQWAEENESPRSPVLAEWEHLPLSLSPLTRVRIALALSLTPIAYENTRSRCTATGAHCLTCGKRDSYDLRQHIKSRAHSEVSSDEFTDTKRTALERRMTGLEEKRGAHSAISRLRLTTVALTALLCCHRSPVPHLRPPLLPLWRLVILPCSMP